MRSLSFEGSAGYVNRSDYPGGQQREPMREAMSRRSAHDMVSASSMVERGVTREERDQAGIRHYVQ
jgi:hypothetical protein